MNFHIKKTIRITDNNGTEENNFIIYQYLILIGESYI